MKPSPGHNPDPLNNDVWENIVEKMALRRSRAHLQKHTRQWESNEHWPVVLESIARLRANIRSHVHPCLILFAVDTHWLTIRGTARLLNILRRKKRGVLQLTHATNGTVTASAEVPATETGEVPPMTLDPGYLAAALEIAPVLWLTDSMNPVVARRPDGVFCVVMPMRLAEGQASETKATAQSPDHAAA